MRKVGKLGGNCCRPRWKARTPDARTEDLAGMHSSALVEMNGFLKKVTVFLEKK